MDYSATVFLMCLSLWTVMHELRPNYWDRFNMYRSNFSSRCRDCFPAEGSFRLLSRGGGGVLPYKGLLGRTASQGMFFGIFVLNRVSILSFFVLIRVSIFIIINFCLKQGIFSNSFVIANGLNLEFRYLLLSYTGYGFGLNVLNRASKIGILDLKQGRKIGDFCL